MADLTNTQLKLECPRLLWAGVAGAALLAIGWRAGGAQAFWQAYLAGYCFWLSVSLGALFFVILHYLVNATWSIVVRRLAEILAVNMVLLAVLFIPLPLAVYPGRFVDLHGARAAYLAPGPFALRWALYFGSWIALALIFWRRARQEETHAAGALEAQKRRLSGLAMVLFGFTIGFGGMDLLMSLSPHWQSTIFGVYFFAGSAVAICAALPLICIALQASGRLKGVITAEHYQDLGKLLFTFVFFWGYIAYSQYMLIWYADLPEETVWYLRRASPWAGGWNAVSVALLFGHWMLPFVALLSRDLKRRKGALAAVCVWLLAMHYVDLYWLAQPDFTSGRVPLNWLDLACLIGLGGIFLAGAAVAAGSRPLLAVNDPRLAESLAFENQ